MNTFGGIPLDDASASAPAPAPAQAAPAPAKKTGGGGSFGGIPLDSGPATSAAPPAQAGGYLEEGGDIAAQTMSDSWSKLKSDFITSQGPAGSPEAMKAFHEAPVWDRVKGEYDQLVATGMLPLDAFNAVVSPVAGAAKGFVAHPIASGLMWAGKPVRDFIRSKVGDKIKLPSEKEDQSAVEDDLMLLGSTVLPFKSAAAREAAAAGGGGGGGAGEARSTFSHLVQRPLTSPQDFAKRYVHRALTSEGITREAAKEAVKKPGTALVDLGGSSMIEAGEQGALTGEGRRLGSKLFFDERLKGRRGRVATTVNKLTNDKNMYEFLDELDTERRTNAGPKYEEAFSGGSHAALKTQFENEFAEASKKAQAARQAVADADSRITLFQAKHRDVGDNVYGNQSRNEDLRFAAEQKAKAQVELDRAEADRSAALERLQIAQEHERTGVKGGLWSPRLQSFLDDPWARKGIGRGLEIQRLEALKDGKKFNPHEYGVTGYTPEGEPIVSKVPNLRLLDAMKRGMDANLREEYTDQFGRLKLDELGRQKEGVRKAFVKELDELTKDTNPAYKQAREAWSGPSAVMEAVNNGMEFHKAAPEELTKYTAGLSEAEREGHKIGVVRNIADKIAEGPAAALRVAKDIVNDDYYQRQLRAVLGEEHFQHILDMAEREVSYAERGSQVLGGSPTARRTEGGKVFEQIGAEILDETVTAAREGLSGFAASPKRLAQRLGGRYIQHLLTGMSQARREAVARLLFSTDKDDNLRAIDELFDEGTVSMPHGPSKKSLIPAAGLAGPAIDPRQQAQQ